MDREQYLTGMRPSEVAKQLGLSVQSVYKHIKEGTIETVEDLLLVLSAYRKTNLELPIKMLDTVKQLAEQENITMSQWVERAINQALKHI